MIPVDGGVTPSNLNKVNHRFSNGDIIINASPIVVPGNQYQIVIERQQTNELVFADTSLLLSGVDDTRPELLSKTNGLIRNTQFSYNSPLQLVFNEPVAASGFSVVKEFRDYSNNPG